MAQQEHYESFAQPEVPVQLDPSLGRNKSSRPWKLGVNQKRQKTKWANTALRLTWEEKKQRKQQMKELRDRLKDFRQKKIEKKKQDKERRKEKKKQKELNALKSGTFEVIKDPKKIKKWNRKIKDQLVKLPAEMFQRLINEKN